MPRHIYEREFKAAAEVKPPPNEMKTHHSYKNQQLCYWRDASRLMSPLSTQQNAILYSEVVF